MRADSEGNQNKVFATTFSNVGMCEMRIPKGFQSMSAAWRQPRARPAKEMQVPLHAHALLDKLSEWSRMTGDGSPEGSMGRLKMEW